MWNEQIIAGLTGPQIVNDSKTPSGRVHVGSLRGVLIHDAIYRALQAKGMESRYLYGIDDFDPLDGLPADAEPWVRDYMGHPLCNIPAPATSKASDLADHYIAEFLGLFTELGVGAEIYRLRDVYRSGRFNEAIDAILRKAEVVRRVYAEVSHAIRPPDWLPFQVVCEHCGKIGTTEVTDYDGQEVTYECKPDLVSWAKGCGHRGRVSPFDGRGKLPWKLEWVAKWHSLGITIEGAGKDHCTKGGSRDVAAACLEGIFGERPPLNVPYEFFLVSGAKMSSSKGIGTAAREMADLLPPEILRFLMIKTPPKKTVNFSTDFEYVVKLYNEHDRLVESCLAGRANEEQHKTLAMIEVTPDSIAYHPVGFQLLTALLQIPHLDIEAEVERRVEGGLNAADKDNLRKRIASARYWMEHFATEESRYELRLEPPASISHLSETQRAFLRALGDHFPTGEPSDEEYQRFIFDTARSIPIEQLQAFQAIYRALFDKDQGPKAGALFSFLDKEFLRQRFSRVNYSRDRLWRETGITPESCETWFAQHAARLLSLSYAPSINVLRPSRSSPDAGETGRSQGVVEIQAQLDDGKEYRLRVRLTEFDGDLPALDEEIACLETETRILIDRLSQRFGLSFQATAGVTTTEEAPDDDADLSAG